MKVLLTHSEGRLEGLAAALEALGFSVTHHPLVRTEFLPDLSPDTGGAADLLGSDWLLFTSRTAVRAWSALGFPLGGTPKLGVVGAATALEVGRAGGTVALHAEPANAQGLLTTFCAHVSPPVRVGLPCGEQALPTLQTGLTGAGFTVAKAGLYRTVTQPFRYTDADLIVLASPSAATALPESATTSALVTLGPSTQQAVRQRGWHATQARIPNVSGVVEAVLSVPPETVR